MFFVRSFVSVFFGMRTRAHLWHAINKNKEEKILTQNISRTWTIRKKCCFGSETIFLWNLLYLRPYDLLLRSWNVRLIYFHIKHYFSLKTFDHQRNCMAYQKILFAVCCCHVWTLRNLSIVITTHSSARTNNKKRFYEKWLWLALLRLFANSLQLRFVFIVILLCVKSRLCL